MKKFERLSPEQRKAEIQTAALQLFQEKGFAASTMENIVERVSLSKGGVYRIYPSLTAILGDIMLNGMRLRNAYYAECAKKEQEAGRALTLPFLVEMIGESLPLYPEISSVYAEFLWEKRRNPELEALYQSICEETAHETEALIRKYGAEDLLLSDPALLTRLTDLMNGAVLSLHVLNLTDAFSAQKEKLCNAIVQLLQF